MSESTPVCPRCDKPHGARSKCLDVIRDDAAGMFETVERRPRSEWRNDHGPACTCMQCVIARSVRRGAIASRASSR